VSYPLHTFRRYLSRRRVALPPTATEPPLPRVQPRFVPVYYVAAPAAGGRDSRSRPLLEAFCGWLDGVPAKVLPKSLVDDAFVYALWNRAELSRYFGAPYLSIDSNAGATTTGGWIATARSRPQVAQASRTFCAGRLRMRLSRTA
jgi:hypothetical protein